MMNNIAFVVYVTDIYLKTLDDQAELAFQKNVRADIWFQKTVEERLGRPYNECSNITDPTYRRRNCIHECKADKLLEANCNRLIPLCNKLNQELDYECEKLDICPQECTAIMYDLSISKEEDLNDTLSIRAFYLSLSYTYLSLTPKSTPADFISSVGGALSLLLGISFLSLIELVDLFVETVYLPFF